ncbi:hypothetical protein [Salimicrobium jeotgali]|nr:hypothetical protein [Salimicrobium jeotgali]MBM7697123.1 hypothetical protein [Salimicrobium jeotgali]
MEEKQAEQFLKNEAAQVMRERKRKGQFHIMACTLQPDGDRYITVRDVASLEEAPTTYIYSLIPYTYEDDADVQDFFIRHKRLICIYQKIYYGTSFRSLLSVK